LIFLLSKFDNMSRYIVSWIALQHDFNPATGINLNGPNADMHRYFYDHDVHLLLSTAKGDDTRSEQFCSSLNKEFPQHNIELHYLNIADPVDIKEVYDKTLAFMVGYTKHELDIYFSPGTSIMQVSWYILHVSGLFKSRIIQGREPKFVKPGIERFWVTNFTQTEIPQRLLISSNKPFHIDEDYFIGKSIKPVYSMAEMVAAADRVPVLILGESGTGKEHLATFIYKNSARSQQKFFTLNCSAMRDELLESRLFGYVKGAFTGANTASEGILKTCDGGILFLDEIGDISGYMQQALLRVLQSGEFLPVGSTKVQRVDVRIIAATHRDLEELCEAGSFRWDLYYRLAVTTLRLPSLNQRGKTEISEMFYKLLKMRAKVFGRIEPVIAEKHLKIIMDYPYPGNVRQMLNLIDHLMVYAGNEITTDDLPEWLQVTAKQPEGNRLDDIIRRSVYKSWKANENNLTSTAKELGVSLNTVKKYLAG
jgi:transcriptional regulator with PAS, ATPase and Fis domain